ncbi:MAG: sigma-54-dependent Fis family transcriptional regulator [Desulfomonile tiedjei]|uniref:Sigma-54-dependent Fis family transcriptional regulator n=1 Tax=Desulfomonile tiedjei TaxID=2358 RepID=A0A9D6Z3J2_9BACT|nr:sigma-54-dependent Fis family transcriptional regulator [Desulfomonile tiedjei]
MKYKILIVDDDRLLQKSLGNVLAEKYDTVIVGSGEEAAEVLRKRPIDLVLLDIRLPQMDGVQTLKRIKEIDSDILVIMMTAYEDVKTVIVSMKMGAYDYLVKPLDIDELDIIIERTLDTLKLKKEIEELRKEYRREFGLAGVVGESDGIRHALQLATTVAKGQTTTVLIEGETGTGKEIIAKTIHFHSARLGKPFICINCGAISKDLIESELFGYEKGAFTGGLAEGKQGKLELAHGGTLFLDEIGELLPSAQVKLLRFLEEREFYPVGGTHKKRVDLRIIAATNRSLEEEISAGKFREDLYYRLNVVKISLPPLRQRREDIIPLALFFIDQFNEAFGKSFQRLSKEAEEILLNHPWKGNVRELRNVIERAVLMENGTIIKGDHFSFLARERSQVGQDIKAVTIPTGGIDLEALTRAYVVQALRVSAGNKARAAKLLRLSRPTLLYRVGKYGITEEEVKSKSPLAE